MRRFFALITVMLLGASHASAEPLAAITAIGELVRFDSATPGTVASVAITGLAPGDVLGGIDVRPATNLLYGFTTNSGPGGGNSGLGRVYTINATTGAAVLAATLIADPADMTAPTNFASVAGTYFGVDFNPVADRLRVVSDMGQNLRINVQTGLTQLDVPLAYVGADANAGTPAAAVASAYTNSVSGAAMTTLYNLDSSISTLVTQTPANDGTLNTQGFTSGVVFPESTFDISGQSGVGYVVLDGTTLASINLASGNMAELGIVGAIGSITGLAVLNPVPEPSAAVIAACGVLGFGLRRRTRRPA